MKTFKILSLLCLGVLFSCRKQQDQPAPLPSPPATQNINLVRIELAGGTQPLEQFKYDESGQLIRRDDIASGAMPVVFTYLNNKPVKAEMILPADGSTLYKYEFLYAGDKLDKTQLIYTGADPNNKKPIAIWKNIYTNNLLTQTVAYGASETEASSSARTMYTYYPNGDLKTTTYEERVENGQFRLVQEISYEYDNQNNPMQKHARYLTGFSSYLHSSAHNIVKETYTEGPNRKVTQVISRNYTYQENEFPLSAVNSYVYPGDEADNYSETAHYIYSAKK